MPDKELASFLQSLPKDDDSPDVDPENLTEFREPVRDVEVTDRGGREQRFYVLTGGRTPEIQAQLQRCILISSLTGSARISDIVFTDVGLLVVAYGDLATYGEFGQSLAGLTMGVDGALVAVWQDAKKKRGAFQEYDRWRRGHRQLDILERFVRKPHETGLESLFLPADELSRFSVSESGVITSHFRSQAISIAVQDVRSVSVEKLERWRTTAARRRKNLSGGPQHAGLPAIIEWAHRQSDGCHDWVASTIEQLSRESGMSVPSHIPPTEILVLHERLKNLDTSDASELAKKLSETTEVRFIARMRGGFIGAAVCGVLSIVIWTSAAMDNEALSEPFFWLVGIGFPIAMFFLLQFALQSKDEHTKMQSG